MNIKDMIKESVLESLRMGDLFVSDIVMVLFFASRWLEAALMNFLSLIFINNSNPRLFHTKYKSPHWGLLYLAES